VPLPTHLTGERLVLETVSRQQSQSVYVGDRTILCRVLGKYLLYADGEDTTISPHLCLNGFWESWITLLLARTIEQGWRCIDIGANHGYYTLLMADAVEEAGRVLAVEPNPRTAQLLARTLELNGLQQRVTVEEKVVLDTDDSSVELVIPSGRGMNATLFAEAGPADAVVGREAASLDRLTADWPWVDLVKIDAEGAEEAIWRGMQRVVSENPDLIVVMEVNVGRYDDPESYVGEIEEAGFPLQYVDYDGTAKPITVRELLHDRVGEDWMLFLRRPPLG
jgi:FkbM family methyltransferase